MDTSTLHKSLPIWMRGGSTMKELEEYHLIVLQPTCIKSIMRSFELLLELKVNFLKSCLGGGIGVDSHLVPVEVAHKITRLQRDFLWGEEEGRRKIAWGNWEVVSTRPRENRGLGIKNIERFNVALIGNGDGEGVFVEELVSDAGVWKDGNWCWRLSWRRQWFTWELPLVEAFMKDLEGYKLRYDREDNVLWKSGSTGIYSIGVTSTKNKMWKSVWCAWVWALWCHRNNIIFKQQIIDLDSVVGNIKYKSWIWLKANVLLVPSNTILFANPKKKVNDIKASFQSIFQKGRQEKLVIALCIM
ncbi:hypothetical protein GmHk_06G016328 [Glycine max]|nr:hypothetical protein GmHk_06G016328 [Glycine max]